MGVSSRGQVQGMLGSDTPVQVQPHSLWMQKTSELILYIRRGWFYKWSGLIRQAGRRLWRDEKDSGEDKKDGGGHAENEQESEEADAHELGLRALYIAQFLPTKVSSQRFEVNKSCWL